MSSDTKQNVVDYKAKKRTPAPEEVSKPRKTLKKDRLFLIQRKRKKDNFFFRLGEDATWKTHHWYQTERGMKNAFAHLSRDSFWKTSFAFRCLLPDGTIINQEENSNA